MPGHEPEQDAYRERQRHDDQADDERVARAIDDAREDVATDRVGAEQERGASAFLPEGRHQHGVAILLVGRMRRDQRREDRQHDQEEKDEEPDHRAAVLGEIVPELGEARTARRIDRNRTGGICSGVCHGFAPQCLMRGLIRP